MEQGDAKEIIVVTGSSGCLGQHIVKLLQEKDNSTKEIRLFDICPYENKLGHKEIKPMKITVGDIRDYNSLLEVFDGADCVIHTAAVIDISLFPDVEQMKTVNVEGTKNVIEACIQKNVPHLVFTSTVDVVIGGEHIFYGTESTTPIPNKFMLGSYAETKCKAEMLVLDANGRTLTNDKKLKTVSIRPTPLYGEQDKVFLYSFLKITRRYGGYYRRIRSLDERLQITYVGNAAWAHICAKDKLSKDNSISGEAFFITDDTPIIDIHENFRPYFEDCGFIMSSYVYPYWIIWICLVLLCFFLRIINCIIKVKNIAAFTPTSLDYMCSTFFYNRSKAILRLDYQPIYTPQKAKENSLSYYTKAIKN